MASRLLLIRRWLLQRFVPERFWPKYVVLDNVFIPIRNTPYSFGTKWVIRNGAYEAEERKLLETILLPGMQVLEMGSSIGIVSAIVAEKVGSSGKVVSIEASETLVQQASVLLSKYPWLDMIYGFGFPVLKAPDILINGFNEVRGSLGGIVSFSPMSSSSNKDRRIWDIERVCNEYGLVPELLIIDIEGSESVMNIVAPQLPSSIRYVLIEIHPHLMPGGIADAENIRKALSREGYIERKSSFGVYLFERIGGQSPGIKSHLTE